MRSILVTFLGLLALPMLNQVQGQTVPDPPQQGVEQPASSEPDPQLILRTRSRFSVGGFVGYQDGLSFKAFGLAQDFAQGFPLRARFSLARTAVEPGSAPDARRIFINDATNGTPKEAGSTWDVGLDGLYPTGDRTHFFGGVRYSRFKANFKYVGGNEDFDVTSSHWGVAAGMEAEFPMGPKMSLLLAGGGEYYFSSRLTGHDTSYSPDGDNVNPRKDYTYSDADDAVDQPVVRPIALIGFSYRLGR
jgi:hypothetical protein